MMGCVYGQVFSHQEQVTFSTGNKVDTLSYSPVIRGTWSIIDDEGNELDSNQVLLDEVKGTIQWQDSLAGNRSLIVHYQTIQSIDFTVVGPAWLYLPPLKSSPVSGTNPAGSLTRTAAGTRLGAGSPSERLVSTGSLFRGITLNSGHGVNLTGGLDLQLQGMLSDGVFVMGSLTDRNLPLQPEGDTKNLDELDQVRISINSNWGGIEVGDFILKSSASQVSIFERKLEGMHLKLHRDRWEAEGALASSQGRYRSQFIQGADGRQGPYHLTSHEGSRNLIVLPGTEKVWLNGQRQERGENYDYTIDYSLGELFFTPRHTIRNDSRITVDFEYTDLVYNRTTGYFSTGWNKSRTSLAITAFSERDILQSNLDLSLSAADKEYLRDIGDSVDEAVISTAHADSQGSYDYLDGIYDWQGAGSGSHQVTFHNVGDQGEYRRVVVGDTIVYQWVPPDQRARFNASYAPFRTLKLPTRHDLVTTDLRFRSSRDALEGGASVGISSMDRNMFSPAGDRDNRDFGYIAHTRWRGQPFNWLQNSLTTELRLKAQGKGQRFYSAGRWDEIEFKRSWDLDQNPETYHWQTLDMLVEGARKGQASAQLGLINTDSVGSARLNWGVIRPTETPLSGQFHQTMTSRLDSERSWYVTGGDIKYNFKYLSPLIQYYKENRHSDSTSLYQAEQWQVGVEARLSQTTHLKIGRERRRDVFGNRGEEIASSWLLAVTRAGDRGTRFTTTLTYNQKTTNSESTDLAYFMGDLAYVHRRAGQPWWVDVRSRLDRTILEMKTVIYDSVGRGLGDFRYDVDYDMYVPDEAGAYRRFLIPAGELRPVNTMKSRFRFHADLNRMKHTLKVVENWAQARLIIQGQVRGETSTYSLNAYMKPALEDTSIGNVYSRWSFDLAVQSRNDRPQYRLRSEGIESISREQLGGSPRGGLAGEALAQRSVDLARTSSHEVSDYEITLDVKVGAQNKFMESLTSVLRNHDISRRWADATLAGGIGARTILSLTVRWQQEVDQELDAIRVQSVSQSMGIQHSVGKRGRLHFDLERITVTADQSGSLPYLLADGFPRGTSYRFRGNGQIHLSGNLLLLLTAYSRKEVERQPFTSMKVELRTQF
jgi:hypothetical protein